MKIIIRYEDVGRNKFSGAVTYEVVESYGTGDIAELAYHEARKHLTSIDVDATYGRDKNEGMICAGGRSVGRFHLLT